MPTFIEFELDIRPQFLPFKKTVLPGEVDYFTHLPAGIGPFRTYFVSCSQDDLYGLVYFYNYSKNEFPNLDELAKSFKNPDFVRELYGEDYMRHMRRFVRSFHRDVHSVLGRGHLTITHTTGKTLK